MKKLDGKDLEEKVEKDDPLEIHASTKDRSIHISFSSSNNPQSTSIVCDALNDCSPHRRRVGALYLAAFAKSKLTSFTFSSIKIPFKGVLNTLSSSPWRRALSLKIKSNDLWLGILNVLKEWPTPILFSNQKPTQSSTLETIFFLVSLGSYHLT